jgi:hypothetical protein
MGGSGASDTHLADPASLGETGLRRSAWFLADWPISGAFLEFGGNGDRLWEGKVIFENFADLGDFDSF